jgi:hypothetical protein
MSFTHTQKVDILYLLGPGSGSGSSPRCPDQDPTKKIRILPDPQHWLDHSTFFRRWNFDIRLAQDVLHLAQMTGPGELRRLQIWCVIFVLLCGIFASMGFQFEMVPKRMQFFKNQYFNFFALYCI